DYALINLPIFFANTIEHYVFIQQLFLQVGKAPPAEESPTVTRARMHQFLRAYLTGMGTLPPEQWVWDELLAFLSFQQLQPLNLLLFTYWTMGAVRHGDYIAKVRVAPVLAFADQVVRRTLDLAAAPEAFRPALVGELRERPYEFDVQVQLCTDLE